MVHGGPKVATALTTAPGRPHNFQPMKLIMRIMLGPGRDWISRKYANSWSVIQPWLSTTSSRISGRTVGKPPKLITDKSARCGTAYGVRVFSRLTTPMLIGTSPNTTIGSGSLPKLIRPNASAANSKAVGRSRCGRRSRMPVAISSPAAVADSPPRAIRSKGCWAWERSSTPAAKPRLHGISKKPAAAARTPTPPRNLVPVQTAMPMMFGPASRSPPVTPAAACRSISDSSVPTFRACSSAETSRRYTSDAAPLDANGPAPI